MDSLKFKDSRRYTQRLEEGRRATSEEDAEIQPEGLVTPVRDVEPYAVVEVEVVSRNNFV